MPVSVTESGNVVVHFVFLALVFIPHTDSDTVTESVSLSVTPH